MSGYAIVEADQVEDPYAQTDVPGEFRQLKHPLETEQVAVTLIRIPPHSDFDQGTGHFHDEIEEIYMVSRGVITMRLGEDVHEVKAGCAVRVAPKTPRSYRNEGDEAAEMWIASPRLGRGDATKLEEFWDASPQAERHRPPER